MEILRYLQSLNGHSGTDSCTFYYGFKEAERLTEGIFVDVSGNESEEKRLKFFNHAKMLEKVASEAVEKFAENNLTVFETNDKLLNFVQRLFGFLLSKGYFEFGRCVSSALASLTVARSAPTFKIVTTSLFMIAHCFESLEEDIVKTVLSAITNIDGEGLAQLKSNASGSKKYKQDVDFVMRLLIAYLKMNDKGIAEFSPKSRDIYVNYYVNFVKNTPAKRVKPVFSNVVVSIINSFFDTVLKVESPSFIHFLVPFVCKLKTIINGRSCSDLFFETAFAKMTSNELPSCLKAKLLSYLRSYIRFMNVDSEFISEIVNRLYKFLEKMTKRISKMLASVDADNVQFVKRTLSHPLFVKLICTITSILTENIETISTKSKIDIINDFEVHFSVHFDVYKTLIKECKGAKEVFQRLNKFLRISKLTELEQESAVNSQSNASSMPKRYFISSTYCSMASLSQMSFDYHEDSDSRTKPFVEGVWFLESKQGQFEGNPFTFLKEFECKYARAATELRREKEIFDNLNDSICVSRRASFEDSELSEAFGPDKRVKTN